MRFPLFVLACSFILLGLQSCEIGRRPLSDPSEIFQKARTLFDERSYEEAESLFVQSIALFRQKERMEDVPQAHLYLGRIYLIQGRYRAALEHLQTAGDESKKINDFRTEAQIDAALGDVRYELRDYEQAIASYQASRSLSSAFNDRESKADIEVKLAEAYLSIQRSDEALKMLETALSYYQSANERGSLAATLNALAEVYVLELRFPQAMNYVNQALTIVKGLDNPELTAHVLLTAGMSARGLGQLNDALRLLRDGANTLRTNRRGREFEVLILFHIGNVYFDHAQFQDAKRYYAEAAQIAQSVGDRIAENYLKAFQIRTDQSILSPAERRTKMEALLKAYQPVAKSFQEIAQRTGEAYVSAQMGRIYQSLGNLSKAREMFQRAVELEDADAGEYIYQTLHAPYLKKLNIKEERSEWYSLLASTLVQLRTSEEAMAVLDRANAKRYYEIFKFADVDVRHPSLKTELDLTRERLDEVRILEIELSRLLSEKGAQIQSAHAQELQGKIALLRRQIAEAGARIVALQPNYEPLLRVGSTKMSDLQVLLPRGTLLVRFLPTANQLYIFALSRNRFEVRSSGVSKDVLLPLLTEYKELLQDPSVYTGAGGEASVPAMTRFATISTQLYEYLLRPVDALLERNLVIVMSREMENFPFHAIERQDRDGNIKYLIELTSVDYLPSVSSLKYKTAGTLKLNRIVAVGNPSGKNWSIDYELRDIRSFFKEASVLIALEASWENLKAAQGDVLQLSTDFIYEGNSSPLGLIAFSDGKTPEESTKIPFERLTELNPYPVIVLSNQFGQGTGLSSAHAMLLRINGTPDVFFNAWFADRKAGKFFSEYFFTHLSNGLAPGDAYRQALLNLIQTKDVNHPHSWAQFFHFGVG